MRTRTRFAVYSDQRSLGRRASAAGMTRLEIAEGLGISPSTVTGWLAGYNRMPDELRVLVEARVTAREKIAAGLGGAR